MRSSKKFNTTTFVYISSFPSTSFKAICFNKIQQVFKILLVFVVHTNSVRVGTATRSWGKKVHRTTESLQHDHEQFIAAGAVLRNAKLYNNAIHQPLFTIPLFQVHLLKLFVSMKYSMFVKYCSSLWCAQIVYDFIPKILYYRSPFLAFI